MTGIEYECLFANGPNLGINDINAAIKLIYVADNSGMDAMSMGITISWAMESFEKRASFKKEDFKCKKYPDGFELTFGNGEAAVTTAEMIRDQVRVLAKLLSEGTRIASRTIDEERGSETYKWAMNSKGSGTGRI